MVSEADIFQLAKLFRSAIERTPKSTLPIGFGAFPSGSCADASIILGVFLADRTTSEFELVRGERGDMSDDTYGTHAWIATGNLVVDITADQFDDVSEPVIVARNSKWHNQFRGIRTNKACFNVYDEVTSGTLGDAYQKVMCVLDAG